MTTLGTMRFMCGSSDYSNVIIDLMCHHRHDNGTVKALDAPARLLTTLNGMSAQRMAIPYIPYEGPVVTRMAAMALGLKRYFTGKPCPHGHLSDRFVSGFGCSTCQSRSRDESRARNPEKYRARCRLWFAENVERRKEYRAAHEEDMAAYNREYRKKNRDKINSTVREWQAKNPEKNAAKARNYRARKSGAEGSHTKSEIVGIFSLQKGRCAHCKIKINGGYHADHIMPLSKGGSNWIRNIQLLCQLCNHRKHALHPVEFAQREGFLL